MWFSLQQLLNNFYLIQFSLLHNVISHILNHLYFIWNVTSNGFLFISTMAITISALTQIVPATCDHWEEIFPPLARTVSALLQNIFSLLARASGCIICTRDGIFNIYNFVIQPLNWTYSVYI